MQLRSGIRPVQYMHHSHLEGLVLAHMCHHQSHVLPNLIFVQTLYIFDSVSMFHVTSIMSASCSFYPSMPFNDILSIHKFIYQKKESMALVEFISCKLSSEIGPSP